MEFKLDFNPEEVAQKMTEAIVTSSFKEMFSKAVEAECKRITEGSWNTQSVIQIAIKDYFTYRIREMLNTEYREQIDNLIKESLTGEKLKELADQLVEKIKVGGY